MIAAQETTAISATAATSAKTQETADGEAFGRALASSLTQADMNEIHDLMQSLTQGLGDKQTVTTRPAGGTSMSAKIFISTTVTINISSDMVDEMRADGDIFSNIREILAGLMNAGSSERLVKAGGRDISRTINIEAGEVRYVEVQRDSRGAQLSISQLALSARQMLADNLMELLGNTGNGSGTAKNTAASISENFSRFTESSGFGSLLGTSSSWRFSSYMTASVWSSVTAGVSTQSGGNQIINAAISATTSTGQIDLVNYLMNMGLFDPLVLDLDDEGFDLKAAENGVYFDIKGDGSPVRTAFIQGGNAFLYRDENGNGTADSIHELFGNTNGFADGWDKLTRLDSNGDGVIDSNDEAYGSLRVWRDSNGDGVNQSDESMGLAEAGVRSIDLRYSAGARADGKGNIIANEGRFTRMDGRSGRIADVWLKAE